MQRTGEFRACDGPSCAKQTPLAGFFCVHCHKLLAGRPRRWIAALLISTPTLTLISLSMWHSDMQIYWLLAAAAVAYLWFAIPTDLARARVLALVLPLSIIQGLRVSQPNHENTIMAVAVILAMISGFTYLVVLGAESLDQRESSIEVILAVSSLALFLYVWALEGAIHVGWVDAGDWPFVRYYWVVRSVLGLGTILSILVSAAVSLSKRSLDFPSNDVFTKSAIYAWEFLVECKDFCWKSFEVFLKIHTRFITNFLLPLTLTACVIGLSDLLAIIVFSYLIGIGSSITLLLGVLAIIFAVQALGFVLYASNSERGRNTILPPYLSLAPQFTSAMLIDLYALAIHASYTFLLATVVAVVLRSVFHVSLLVRQFGAFSLLELGFLILMLITGYRKRNFRSSAFRASAS